MSNIVRWVHLSDIHIGHQNYVENAFRKDLPAFLEEIQGIQKINALFITGDIIYSPSYADQKSKINDSTPIKNIVEAIQSPIGVDNKATCISIGNHDLVRITEKSTAVKQLNQDYRSNAGEIQNNLLDNLQLAEGRFALLYSDILGRNYQFGHHIETISLSKDKSEKKLEVLNLDTCITAEAVQDDGKTRVLQDGNLIIGMERLQKILDQHNNSDPIIAIGHHPLGALMEDERTAVIREMQKAGITIYLCGHTHNATIINIGDDNAPLIQICCGTNMERKENQEPTDMSFYVSTYDLDKKTIIVETYEYTNINASYQWIKSRKTPFHQSQFELDVGNTTFYYPRDKAPHYSIIEKYTAQFNRLIDNQNKYLETKLNLNPRRNRPIEHVINESQREIIEAETGFGKTVYLHKKAFDELKASGTNEIRNVVLDGKTVIPFYIDFESINIGRDDVLFVILSKSIHLSIQNNRFQIFSKWITQLANNNRLLLLIDGLDKVDNDLVNCFCDVLRQFISEYPKVKVCIASKPFVFDYNGMKDKFNDFYFYILMPFCENDIYEYCSLWYSNNSTSDEFSTQAKAKEIADEIIGDSALREMASVPLLLNTLLQVHAVTDSLPKNRNQLYSSFIYALLKHEPDPDSCIQLLSAIAFEMHKEQTTSYTHKRIERLIGNIIKNCDWLGLHYADRELFNSSEFLSRMDNNSKLLKKLKNIPDTSKYSFYNNYIQDYFTALALSKGFYQCLKKDLVECVSTGERDELPLISEIVGCFDRIEDSNMLELTILQLNAYETTVLVEKLISHIETSNQNPDTTIVTSSHLRNLLLRVILDGAYVTKEQRHKAFVAVQGHNIFNLQADLLEEVSNSVYSGEFSETCSHYINELFRILREEENPIQYICDEIGDGELIHTSSELDKNLYVLDGIIWSKGHEYIDIYQKDGNMEELIRILETVLKSDSADALCKRRACGVLQRLLDIHCIENLSIELVDIIIRLFEVEPKVAYRKETLEDDKYAGIRIFHSIPLSENILKYLFSLPVCADRVSNYLALYNNANNPKDMISAFEAAIICRCFDREQVKNEISKDKFANRKIIDYNGFKSRVETLLQYLVVE